MRTEYRGKRRNKMRKALFDLERQERKRRWKESMEGWKLQELLDLKEAGKKAVAQAEEIIKDNPPFQRRG